MCELRDLQVWEDLKTSQYMHPSELHVRLVGHSRRVLGVAVVDVLQKVVSELASQVWSGMSHEMRACATKTSPVVGGVI